MKCHNGCGQEVAVTWVPLDSYFGVSVIRGLDRVVVHETWCLSCILDPGKGKHRPLSVTISYDEFLRERGP